MRLIFIRHAESLANIEGRYQGRGDYDLSDCGRQQAEQLSRRFTREQLSPTQIYSSPLRRAMETAEIVCRNWNLAIEPLHDLIEYDVGAFTGLTWPDIVSRHPAMAEAFQVSRDWDSVDHVEPISQRHDRAARVVETIIDRHMEQDVVLCFSHGGILQHVISVLLGADRIWGIPVRNTGVFDFSLDKKVWSSQGRDRFNTKHCSILAFNDANHLSVVMDIETASSADEA
jgi:broad specificity phosphatase PhoE